MEFEDDAFVLSARPLGETGAIVELLTARARQVRRPRRRRGLAADEAVPAGRRAGHRPLPRPHRRPAGLGGAGAGRGGALGPVRRPAGAGRARLGRRRSPPARCPSASRIPAPSSACEALIAALAAPEIWPAVYVRFEAGLLADLGFGLDLSRCAVTGSTDDLIYVSPRTGRAVSAAAGEAYKDRLLALPPFLLSAQGGLGPGDIGARPRHHRPLPRALRLRPAQPTAAAGAAAGFAIASRKPAGFSFFKSP